MSAVVLVASGPSAAKVAVPDGATLVAVNGSYAVLPRRPDVWMLGEREAARHFHAKALEYYGQGTRILGRPYCRRELSVLEVVSDQLGPPFLHHLHADTLVIPEGPHSRPGNSRPWITSGVLALWWILDAVKPERVDVYGIDGYPPPGAPPHWQTPEYADGVEACASRPVRTDDYCALVNQRQGNAIWALSNYYTGTEIVMASRHQHYHSRWRVKVAA